MTKPPYNDEFSFILASFENALANRLLLAPLALFKLLVKLRDVPAEFHKLSELLQQNSECKDKLDNSSHLASQGKISDSLHYLIGMLDDDCGFIVLQHIESLVQTSKLSKAKDNRLLKTFQRKLKEKQPLFQPLRQAESLYHKRQYAKVVAFAEEHLQEHPDDMDMLLFKFRAQYSHDIIKQLTSQILEKADSHTLLDLYPGLVRLIQLFPRESDTGKKLLSCVDKVHLQLKKQLAIRTCVYQAHDFLAKGNLKQAQIIAGKAREIDPRDPAVAHLDDTVSQLERFEKKLKAAKSAFHKGSYQKALQGFQQAINVADADHLQSLLAKVEKRINLEQRYNEALILFKKEEWEQAVRILIPIVKEEPAFKHAANYLEKATTQVKVEELHSQVEEAINQQNSSHGEKLLQKMRALDPEYSGLAMLQDRLKTSDDLTSLTGDAEAKLKQKEFQAARETIEKALDIDPTYRKALRVYKLIEEEEKIADILEEALKAFSDERYDKIITLCRKGLMIQPDNKELLKLTHAAKEQLKTREKLFEARAFLTKDKPGEANKILSQILSVDSENAEAKRLQKRAENKILINTFLQKGLNSLHNKDLSGASIIFGEALKIEPENKKIKEYLDKINRALQLKDKDKKEIKKEVQKHDEEAFDRVKELMAAKDFDKALAIVGQKLKQDAKDEKAARLKGKLEQIIKRLGELESEAIAHFQKGDYVQSLTKWKKLLSHVNPQSSRYQTIHLQFQGVLETMANELFQKAERLIQKGNREKAMATITVLSKLPIANISEKVNELKKSL